MALPSRQFPQALDDLQQNGQDRNINQTGLVGRVLCWDFVTHPMILPHSVD